LTAPPPTAADGDGPLLTRFVRTHDQEAFAALVRRHGPMVLGVARRLLGDVHDAEDVFQATFLLLAQKGPKLHTVGSLAGWLHAVSFRLALKARARSALHLRHQTAAAQPGEREQVVNTADGEPIDGSEGPASAAVRSELRSVLDEEMERLPEKYRAPVILCYLEGLTNEEAATRLGWPVGSVKGRLSRARDLLQNRLARRGLSLALLGAIVTESTAKAVPASLLDVTVRAAAAFAVGQSAAISGVSAGAADLIQGALRTMLMHKLKWGFGVAAAIAIVAGAGVAFLPNDKPNAVQAADEAPVAFTVPAETPQIKTDREAVVKGDTEFALDLYQRLAKSKDENLFLSPYSISTALAMTYAGARGTTAEEMAKTLHFPVPQERLAPAFAGLIGRFQADKEDKGYQLSVANAIWGQKSYPWKKDFLNTTQANYAAGLRELDFGATEEARKTINGWVEQQTKDKIKDLIKPGVLDADTRMVLTNAIYFKGDWKEQFNKNATKEEPFLGTANADAQAPLMHQRANYGYLEGDGFQILELPYKGDELSMVVLLPKKADGLADLEKQLTAEKLNSWLAKLGQQEVIVSLPRFKVTAQFSLAAQLQSLGMNAAFSKAKADFSGMTAEERLYISAVIHKAFVDVNEEGTEAAAATAVVPKPATARIAPPPPVFRADHPFVFLIRDRGTGSVLFLGRLAQPAS
jgi:serpin B